MALLECKHLVKVYPGGKRAVKDVSLHVEKGEIVALLRYNDIQDVDAGLPAEEAGAPA